MISDMDRMRQALNSTPEQQAALRRVLDQLAPPTMPDALNADRPAQAKRGAKVAD